MLELITSIYFVFELSFSYHRKDVKLPVGFQRAMAAEAESAREARAKVYKESI